MHFTGAWACSGRHGGVGGATRLWRPTPLACNCPGRASGGCDISRGLHNTGKTRGRLLQAPPRTCTKQAAKLARLELRRAILRASQGGIGVLQLRTARPSFTGRLPPPAVAATRPCGAAGAGSRRCISTRRSALCSPCLSNCNCLDAADDVSMEVETAEGSTNATTASVAATRRNATALDSVLITFEMQLEVGWPALHLDCLQRHASPVCRGDPLR